MRRATALLLSLVALVGWRPAALQAQMSQTAAVTIQVGVANGLTVLRDRDLDFGNVVTNSGVTTVTLASPNVGKLHIYGGQNRLVHVTFTPPAQLLNGASSIPYAWGAAYNESVNNAADAATVTVASTAASFRLRNTGPLGNYGQAFLWVFGSINVGSVPTGLYKGTFQISAAY